MAAVNIDLRYKRSMVHSDTDRLGVRRNAPCCAFTEKASPAWSDGTFGTRAEYPEGAVTVSHVEGHCWKGGVYCTSKMNYMLCVDESPGKGVAERWCAGDGARSRRGWCTLYTAAPNSLRPRHVGGR